MTEQEIKDFKDGLVKGASEALGSTEKGEAYADGILKTASAEELLKLAFWGDIGAGAGKAIGAGVVGLALGALAGRVGSVFDQAERAQMHVRFTNALASVKATNRIVKAADQTKINSYAETIFKFAPHVAGDPNVLASLLANVIQGESIDPMTIKTLVELENKYIQNAQPMVIK